MKNLLLLPFILFSLTVTSQTRFITSDDFRGKFRGFNVSLVQDYSLLSGKNLPLLKSTGANHARVWIHYYHDASGTYYPEKSTAIQAIDSAVRIARKTGLYLILTVEFLPRQGADDWWGNATRKKGIIKVWQTLASRYKNEKIIAAYDLMNEPRRNETLVKGRTKTSTDTEYMTFQSDMVNAIRLIDSNHVIAIEVLENQMLARVKPLPQTNLIYSPHGYSPLYITHQGVSGTARAMYPDLTTKLSDGTMYTANYFSNVTYWRNPAEFQKKYNAVIWVGEFACVNWAPKNKEGQWTSTRWMNDAIDYMESLGWSWSAHAWREYIGWDAEVPSSWYEGKTFSNGKPTTLPTGSARSSTAPTIVMLKQKFSKNLPIQ